MIVNPEFEIPDIVDMSYYFISQISSFKDNSHQTYTHTYD